MSVYILLLWDKTKPRTRPLLSLSCGLPLLTAIHLIAGHMPVELWILGMVVSFTTMALMISWATGGPWRLVGHLTIRAFILAEFLASLAWQIVMWFADDAHPFHPLSIGVTALIYAAVLVAMWLLEKRHVSSEFGTHLADANLLSATLVGLVTFAMSNLSFVTVDTPFSGRAGTEVFYIRTLVDLCGLVALYAQQERLREVKIASELAVMEAMLHAQHNQYLQAKADTEAVARARHDLKHHIALVRSEVNSEQAKEYLQDLERSVGALQQRFDCGHPVLDVIFASKATACAAADITFTAVADGTLLRGMPSMDVATLLGNALDNAIEACSRVADNDKRLITLALHAQGSMVVLRIENWFDGHLVYDSTGHLATRKPRAHMHGIGLRSIQHTAHKYGGEVTKTVSGNWFTLTVLLPSTQISGSSS
ncbi:ATP-binding protein [Schaalia suimastitidis]|uniref:ATP-binding protein n=1 Tax=Schaalia suimastitidis TaxID=121163 RepID=UPI001F0A963B|nr:ATP-binding protein [Schaalia suimastitidis]